MPLLDASPSFLITAAFASLLVGLSKGGLPLVAMLAVPILALAMPPLAAAALLLPIYVASDVVGVYLYRRRFSRRNLAILIPAAGIGVLFGWATATIVSDRLVTFSIGAIGLAFCLDAVVKRGRATEARPADVPRGLFWGALSGFTSFVSHSGGPPYQIYMLPQKLEKLVFAGTSTILFAIVNLMKLVPYWALGQFSIGNLELAALLSPIAILGVYAGWKLVTILPEKLFYVFIRVALFLVSLKLVVDALIG